VAVRDPELTVFNATTLDTLVNQNFYLVRMVTWMYGGIGVYGLLLAAIGLAGVTAHAVVRRTKEIGIRVALGAPRASVLRLVLREGFWLTFTGAVVGLASAWAVTRMLATYFEAVSRLTQTTMSDPVLMISAPALLVALALLACYWPARRASRINPIQALREE
jgi:ABC-type antimicrobial peptide transport system permease subunit